MAAPMRLGLRYLGDRFLHETSNIHTYSGVKSAFGISCLRRNVYTSQTKFSFSSLNLKRLSVFAAVAGASLSSLTGLYAGLGHLGSTATSKNVVCADEGFPPKYKPIRKVRNDTDTTGLKLTLFQYQTCPFCCKVRAYLDYHGFSYDVIEVNSVWRTQTKWTKYKKVPILVCHGMGEDGYLQMNDSSVIISALETFLVDQTQPLDKILTYYPGIETQNAKGKNIIEFPNKYFVMYMEKQDLKTTPERRKEEREWRAWVDEWFVHTLSPNIYRTPSEALSSFQYFSEVGEWQKVFSAPERLTVIYVGAVAMYLVGKMLKKRHNLKDDVRQSLYDACNKWTKAVGNKRRFMGGDEPDLSDLAMYGVLSAIEGCAAFEETLQHTHIKTWFYDMKEEVALRGGQTI